MTSYDYRVKTEVTVVYRPLSKPWQTKQMKLLEWVLVVNKMEFFSFC